MTDKDNTTTGSNEGEYKVGDKKPPLETRFKKGISGNPAGRTPGVRNFSTIYMIALRKLANKNGMEPDQLEEDIIVKALQSSYAGNFKYFKDIQDRLHGQPVKSIDHTTGGDKIRTNTITFVNYDGESES